MTLLRMDTLLKEARRNHVALGAFQCWDSLNVQGIAMAAARTGSPVIFQTTSMEYAPIGGPEIVADIVNFYIRKYGIDAALHLDHGGNIKEVEECLRAGYTSVMLDASMKCFEENVSLTKDAADLAHGFNASLEAELGHVGGGDGGDGTASVLTEPKEAAEFVARTGVDCLAVAVGTVHGEYRGKPDLKLDRLAEIAQVVKNPLVLHGGSGTPPELLQKAIALGIAKINICTDISKAFLNAIEETRKELTPSLAGNFYRPVVQKMSEKVESLIRLFRREGC